MSRLSATICLTVLVSAGLLCCAEGKVEGEGASFSDFFPPWTNGYLEVTDLSNAGGISGKDINAELAAKKFAMLVQNNLGISAEVFIKEFLGQHFAIGWGGASAPNQFGLICTIRNKATIMNFLSASKAYTTTQGSKPSSQVRTFRLPSTKIRTAVIRDSHIILATTGSGTQANMFGTMVDIAEGNLKNTLSQNPTFQRAKKHFKKNYQLFATFLGSEGQSNIKGTNRFIFSRLFQQLQYLSIGIYTVDDSVRCDIFTRVDKIAPAFWPENAILLDDPMLFLLRMKYDLVYCSVINPARWYGKIVSLADKGSASAVQYRSLLELILPNEYLRDDFLASLGPEMMLIITQGRDGITGTQPAATHPAEKTSSFGDISLIVRTSNPSASTRAMEQISKTIADFLTVHSFASDRTLSKTRLDTHMYNGFIVNVLTTNRQHLHQLCWTVAGGYIFISSRREMLYKLLDTAFNDDEGEGKAKSFNLPEVTHWFTIFDPSALAKRLKYLGNPLSHIWNRFQNRFSSNPIKLGIGTKIVQEPKTKKQQLTIAAILPSYPAWGKLQIGDIIISVDGKPLDKEQIQEDFNQKIKEACNNLGEVELTLIRKEVEHQVKIVFREPALENTVKSVRLVDSILESLGKKIKTVKVNCGYTPAGEIDIHIEMKKK